MLRMINAIRTLVTLSLALALCLLASNKSSGPECPVCPKRGGIDMPVSLAAGLVRTPEFPVKHKWYTMEIRSEWRLPSHELQCKMGFTLVPTDPESNTCRIQPLIDLDWSVLDGDQVVAHGSAKDWTNDFEAGAKYLSRIIGQFEGQSKHRYVIEVRFAKDASALDVTNPRLVISPPEFSF